MTKDKPEDEDEREPSRAAGGCVLAVLAGAVLGVVFARSPTAGVITVWVLGVAAVWWAARRRMSDSSATPPPQEWRPSCNECAGQELLSVTPSQAQKGMLIYSFALAERPSHTHLHIAEETNQ